MDNDRIHRLLAELHRELSKSTTVDAESRRMLAEVLRDIEQLSPPPQEAADETTRLREAALRLEAEHPRLATTIGALADTLAKLGI